MAAKEAEFAERDAALEIDLNGDAEGTDSRLKYVQYGLAAAIAPDAFAFDDAEYFEGGRLIVEFTERSTADDQLQIVRGPFGDDSVSVIGKDLYFGDSIIGSITGGTDGSTPLVIDFHSKMTTPGIVQAVLRSIGYANRSEEPVEGERFVSFTLFDPEGAASRAGATIYVTPAVAPEIDLNGDRDGTGSSIKYVESGAATAIAPDAIARDDSDYFDGGSLIVEFRDGSTSDDQLQIVAGKSGEAMVYAIESDLYFRDSLIGSITGGTGGSTPLLISFHEKVTIDIVEAVIRSIGYANFSQNPHEGQRVLTFTLIDRVGAASLAVAAKIYVVPVDNPAVAEDDTVTTTEDKVGIGNLFDANGPGNDYDPDTGRLAIAAVNGSAAYVGRTITLRSGALLTVNGDGTYRYDPNGQFDALTDNSSGATNSFAIDTFEYTLAGGDTATVTVVVTGVAGAGDKLMGDETGNRIISAERSDMLLLGQGGDDVAFTGAGGDVIYFGSAFTGDDKVDGGDGRDVVVLQGNYELKLGETSLTGIESLSLQSGANDRWGDGKGNLYDYAITTVDSNVAAGEQLIVNGQSLREGEDLSFDGSAERDGKFLVYGGYGVDTLRGGEGNDAFFFEGTRWGPEDRVDGGAGRDALIITGGKGLNHIEFGSDSLTGIESISLNPRYAADRSVLPSYELVLNAGNVAAGATLIVNGSALADPEQTISVDGSGVKEGKLILFGGAGRDTLIGGGGGDLIEGGAGGDSLTGGGGADIFRYAEASTGHVTDFTPGEDRIDLRLFDADSQEEDVQAFRWIGSETFSGKGAASAGELRVYRNDGTWFAEGDTNGDGKADLVIALTLPLDAKLSLGDFLL
ncbi:MAG TPA: Ig-like domain-containing protein [Allosphingosinicella sp.]|jgi:Ca2+-binding RTX toxin-like protein